MAFMSSYFKPKRHNSTHGFDLSQKHVFSTRLGVVKPVCAIEYVPGDHHRIDLKSIMRTQAFNTAAFVRASVKFDVFRVNYATLWHPFNQFITQREDKHSANQRGIRYCPTISLGWLLAKVYDLSVHGGGDDQTKMWLRVDIHGYNLFKGFCELLDMLGYGNYYLEGFDQLTDAQRNAFFAKYNNVRINVFRLAAYQHIWYDIYRDKYRDNNNPTGVDANSIADYVSGFNFDDIPCNDLASSYIENQVGATDYRFHNLCQLRYHHWKYDLFTSPMPSTQFGSVSTVSLNSSVTVNGSASLDGTTGIDTNYRTSNDERYKMPLTTDVLPSNGIKNGVFGYDLEHPSGFYRQQMQDANNDYELTPNLIQVSHSHSVSGSASISSSGTAVGSFDILAFRRAEVLQKYREQLMRAGNMVDDTFEAIYGRKPYSEQDNNVQFLGSWQSPLEINPVESTAQTDSDVNGSLGSLAARGLSTVGQKPIDIKCDDFGVIMVMMSVVPESEFSALGMDKANRLFENTDFFNPFMQNIGLEAVDRSVFDFANHVSERNQVIGYASRDWHMKTAIDKVHRGFFDDTIVIDYNNTSMTAHYMRENVDWVAPRKDLFPTHGSTVPLPTFLMKLSAYYVDPAIYDSVWAVHADIEDPFIVNAYFDVKSIRPMSVLGLPEF